MPAEENTADCYPYPFEVWHTNLLRILIYLGNLSQDWSLRGEKPSGKWYFKETVKKVNLCKSEMFT